MLMRLVPISRIESETSQKHVISDGQGVPLALIHTGANVHDSQAAMPLADSIPSINRPGSVAEIQARHHKGR
jgi:hypothetical protein